MSVFLPTSLSIYLCVSFCLPVSLFILPSVHQSIAGKNSWQLASMDITVGSPRFPMFNLQKGKSYCFRVRSVNKFGVSEPSEPSPPISLGQPQGEGEE